MFCKHDWKKIVNDYMPSFAERNKEMVQRATKVPYDAHMATKIIILKCNKCGKLDKTIEKV